ncbi:hypothetical protein DL93DRAFT_2233147 [Clavulina sp. PMI_390]|nr:hypothetical protein DL93DRAFT_2233147 [Clavulina sp. PMI_390]
MAKQQDWDWLEDVLDVLEECPHLSAVHLRIGDGSCWKPLVNAPKGFSENQSNIVEYFLDSRIPAYIRSLDLSIHYPLARISSELCDFGDKFPELEKLRISARLLPDGQSPLYGSGLPKLSDFTILRCGDLPFALGSPLETLRITVAEFAEDQNSLEVFANTLERFQDTLKCLIVEIPLPRQKNATAEEELVTRVLSRMVKVYLPNLKRAEFSLQWHKTWSILAHDKVSVNERLSEIMSSFSPATEEFLSSLETLSVLGVHIEHEKIGMLTDVCFMHLPALRCLTFDNFASEGHGQMTFAGTLDRGVNVNRLYDIV